MPGDSASWGGLAKRNPPQRQRSRKLAGYAASPLIRPTGWAGDVNAAGEFGKAS